MKKGTKIGLGVFALLGGAMILTGCTNSFCSKEDKAHILYAFDAGVTQYYDASKTDELIAQGYTVKNLDGYNNVVYVASLGNSNVLNTIVSDAKSKQYLSTPSLDYFVEFDKQFLSLAAEASGLDKANVTADIINGTGEDHGILSEHGDLKFYVKSDVKKENVIWNNWNAINQSVRALAAEGAYVDYDGTLTIDECPTTDFVSYYQSTMNSKVSAYRSCLAINDGYFGHYNNTTAKITGKSWGYAWGVGPLSGLLVYPIGWGIDSLTNAMLPSLGQGWAQLMAILIITIIVRGLMLAVTFRQTAASQKMQALQPEVAKIQAKYPNSNTNNYEKQRLAEETQRLYKKHKINPLSSILIMFVQFPIFICVWSAMQGSAWLSTGQFLGLHLSDSISSVLTTWSNWKNAASTGVITALVLFLLMSGAQVVAMLLPQWIQKRKTAKLQKLGKNPAQKEQNNRMKWFTYIMLIMIIVMGFSLASAMGVYWFVGALISVAQTLITNAVMDKKKQQKVVNR